MPLPSIRKVANNPPPLVYVHRICIRSVWIINGSVTPSVVQEALGRMTGDIKHFETKPDGSTVVAVADGSCLAVDFSGASGADGILVMTGPGAPKDQTVSAGGTTFSLKFLTRGKAPEPKVVGNRVRIGDRVVSFRDGIVALD